MIYKFYDVVFCFVFSKLVEWGWFGFFKSDVSGWILRLVSLYIFFDVFFEVFKFIIINYVLYIVDSVSSILFGINFVRENEKFLW